ncbi:hypothetical protein [Niallia sp. 03133]|uniref:hypothetical protein n=1 Tax=Niallia sp. 03133 TaxID=3458060 RepID=UPI0040441FB6
MEIKRSAKNAAIQENDKEAQEMNGQIQIAVDQLNVVVKQMKLAANSLNQSQNTHASLFFSNNR